MRTRRRSVLAAAATAAALLVPATTGSADIPYESTVRIPGDSGRAVALQISQTLYEDGQAGAVVLTREDTFPDALGAAALTADVDAPLLFTPNDALPDAVEDEIRRVLPPGGTVYLLGGTAALSVDVERRLDDLGFRTPRFPGRDRIETAALIARFVGSGPDDRALLVRATGNPDLEQGWVDSVSCGAFAARTGIPILLTSSGSPTVSPETAATLDRLGIRRVDVCGGSAAVPTSQLEQLDDAGLRVRRHAGADRVETAVAVARRLWGVTERADRVFVVANGFGTAFGPGLAAAPLAAALNAPLLLVGPDSPATCGQPPDGATFCFLAEAGGGKAAGVVAVGGQDFVPDATFAAVADAAGLERDTTPPPVPGNVGVEDVPEDDGLEIHVSWDAVQDPGAVRYAVYARRSDAGGSLTRANASVTTATGETSLLVTVPDAGVSYDVAVDAVDEAGNRSALSATVAITPEDEVPAAPSGVAPQVQAVAGGVRVTWVPNLEADVAGYIVERVDPNGISGNCEPGGLFGANWSSPVRIDVPGGDTSSYVDAGAQGSDRCYRYRVYDDSDPANVTAPSAITKYDAP